MLFLPPLVSTHPPTPLPTPDYEQYASTFTNPGKGLSSPGGHEAKTPYSDPGGFSAGLHSSAGAPLSETPVGIKWVYESGLGFGIQPVKVMFG